MLSAVATESDELPPESLGPSESSGPWLKVDLHLHCAEDPLDAIDYPAEELLARAAKLGFAAVAITLHGHVFCRPELLARARELGVLLIVGAELRVEGADVVVLNISEEEAAGVRTFGDLRALRQRRGEEIYILAPHPFYHLGGSIGRERLLREIDLFDGIEQCHFHTRWLDLNRQAKEVAERYGKPLVATSDAHRLDCFGRHFTEVRTEGGARSAEAVFAALRAGRLRAVSPSWSIWQFLNYAWWVLVVHEWRLVLNRWG